MQLDHAELHAFLAARMPAFMVPRYIEFVQAPERTEAMKRIKKEPLRANPVNEQTWDAQANSARSRGCGPAAAVPRLRSRGCGPAAAVRRPILRK